jgi:hypothetical protein
MASITNLPAESNTVAEIVACHNLDIGARIVKPKVIELRRALITWCLLLFTDIIEDD